ncbi:MAG TPA: hypothetical protein PLT87_01785 [Spirochaetales bacterium]|nr:hypothetical protein [Spirochaetales bacterium]
MRNLVSKPISASRSAVFAFVLILVSLNGLGIYAQGTNTKVVGETPSPAVPQANTDESVAVFQIRSAFSLTPAMVQVLQKKMEEFAAQSGAKPSPSGSNSSNQGTSNQGTAGTVIGPGAVNKQPGSTSQTSQQSASAGADRSTEIIPWSSVLSRSVPMATPFDVRVVGDKIVAIMQIVPLDQDSKGVNLMIQTQIWAKQANGTVSYRTFIQPLSLPVGARIFYYPLGFSTKEGAPIVVEIKVDIVEKPKKLH